LNTTISLLDKYCEVCKHASDSAAARALKVQPSAVNNWRHGRSHPDAESVERMCLAIGESVAKWLPLVEAERARSPEAKRVWLRLAQAAAVITLAIGLDVYTPESKATAVDLRPADNNGCSYTLCVYVPTPTRGLVHADTGFRRLFPMVLASWPGTGQLRLVYRVSSVIAPI
jgi:transcriptional regulator with XRE-family HTH domain